MNNDQSKRGVNNKKLANVANKITQVIRSGLYSRNDPHDLLMDLDHGDYAMNNDWEDDYNGDVYSKRMGGLSNTNKYLRTSLVNVQQHPLPNETTKLLPQQQPKNRQDEIRNNNNRTNLTQDNRSEMNRKSATKPTKKQVQIGETIEINDNNNINESTELQRRLDEMLVFELKKDGGRNYLNLTVRGLHKHVLWCITQPLKVSEVEALKKETTKRQSKVSSNEPDASEVVVEQRNEVSNEPMVSKQDEEETETTIRFSHLQSVLEKEAQATETIDPTTVGSSTAMNETRTSPQQQQQKQSNRSNATNTIITSKERLGGYLHPRDMRRLVSPFSSSNEPDVIVRRHVLLLNFDPLRAIILRDRLLVLVPNGADSLLRALEQQIRNGTVGTNNTILGTKPVRLENLVGTSSIQPINNNVNHDDEEVDEESDKNMDDHKEKVIESILQTAFQKTKVVNNPNNNDFNNIEMAKDTVSTTTTTSTTTPSLLFDDAGEWDDIHQTSDIDLSFELQCVDCVLFMATRILMNDTYRLYQTNKRINQNQKQHQQPKRRSRRHFRDPLSAIRYQKNATIEMYNRVDRFVKSMYRILDRDEDMALMNVSHLITTPQHYIKPIDIDVINDEMDEPQLILETHLQVGLTLENALTLMQGQLETSTEHYNQKMDTQRNRILFANMIISVFSLCVTLGSFVGSIFGMNVPNSFEENNDAFLLITIGSIVGCTILCCLIMFVLIISGTVPLAGYTINDDDDDDDDDADERKDNE